MTATTGPSRTPELARAGSRYVLWFVNGSGRSGKACVYHAASNVTCNLGVPSTLAWMLAGANPTVMVQFVWQLDYDFAWFDYASPRSQQLAPAAPNAASSTTLSFNEYGFFFGAPQTGDPSGSLIITEQASIPSINNAVAGIGMHGAGTFAKGAQPNQKLVFTPATTLAYAITFGSYTFVENDAIDPATLNPPGSISYPSGIYTMSAVLDDANFWTILPGAPQDHAAAIDFPLPVRVITYEAGRGII